MSTATPSGVRSFARENAPLTALVVLLVILPFITPYVAFASTVLMFSLLALSFIFLFGYMGYLTFGAAMFFALGAYTMALLNIHLSAPLLPAMAVTIVFVAIVALGVGFVCFRRGGVYFALLTLAFNQLFYNVFYQLRDLTGGPTGLGGIDRPALLGVLDIGSEWIFYYFTALIFLGAFLLTRHLVSSTFGSVLKAIHDNEIRVDVLGYDPTLFKYAAFAYSAALGALGGALFAMQQQFVGVESSNWEVSADAIIIALIGGAGTIYGAPIGALIYLTAEEILAGITFHWRLPIGVIVVLLVLYRPDGTYPIIEELVERIRNKYDL